jgi:GDP-fucose transporter C1
VATSQIKHGVITISYWGNLVMALGLVPFILLNGELDALRARLLSPDQQWATFVVGSAVTGVFGFLLGIANILSIKVSNFFPRTLPGSHRATTSR